MPRRPHSPGGIPAPIPDALGTRAFSGATAKGAGVTPGRLRGPRFQRLHRGVFAAAEPEAPLKPEGEFDFSIRALMLAMPDAAALHGVTAAAWYGLPIPDDPDRHVIVPAGHVVPRRRAGLVTHEGAAGTDICFHRGVRVTTPERTWLDLSLVLDDIELVVVGDAMVRAGHTTPELLIESADAVRRRRGIVRARSLARLVMERVDSPQETRLRITMLLGGLPTPEVNPDVNDDFGGWIGRPDLAYVRLKIAIQYDGDVHRTNKKRWRADISRDEVMREHGWEVLRVTADDLRRPTQLCRRIQAAIARQSQRLGLPENRATGVDLGVLAVSCPDMSD